MKQLVIITAVCLSFSLQGQTIEKFSIDSGGANTTSGGIEILYTIGEVAIQEASAGNIILSEGFINPSSNAIDCALSLSKEVITVASKSGGYRLDLLSGTSWEVTNSSEWLNVSPASGDGDQSIVVQRTENTLVTRKGSITITNGCDVQVVLSVTQNGAIPCQLSLSKELITVASKSGGYIIDVTANSYWEVTATSPWLTVIPMSGDGSGSINIRREQNTSVFREGMVTLTTICGDQKMITVNQNGAIPCELSLSKELITVASKSGGYIIDVTANSYWEVTATSPWLTVIPMSGDGSGSINIRREQNTSVFREGMVTLTNVCGDQKMITVNQNGAIPCELSLSKELITVASKSGGYIIDVTANSYWEVTDMSPWLTVIPMSGDGSGSINIRREQNTSVFREGMVTLTTICGDQKMITVNQNGAIPCELTVSREQITVNPNSGGYIIDVTANSYWEVTATSPWLTVIPMSGDGSGSINIRREQNTSVFREGMVTLTNVCGDQKMITVNQNGAIPCELTVSREQITVNPNSGGYLIDVTANSYWEVTDMSPWLTVIPMSGDGSVSINIRREQNTGELRVGTVTLTNICNDTVVITVTQNAGQSSKSSIKVSSSKGLESEVTPLYPIYPNPTAGAVTITGLTSSSVILQIGTTNGAVYYHKRVDVIGNSINFSIADLPVGMYLITVITNQQQVQYKILKKE